MSRERVSETGRERVRARKRGGERYAERTRQRQSLRKTEIETEKARIGKRGCNGENDNTVAEARVGRTHRDGYAFYVREKEKEKEGRGVKREREGEK